MVVIIMMILMDRGVQKAIIVDLIGDGDGGDREKAKNQSLDLRQYDDFDGDDDNGDDDDIDGSWSGEGNYRGSDWRW